MYSGNIRYCIAHTGKKVAGVLVLCVIFEDSEMPIFVLVTR